MILFIHGFASCGLGDKSRLLRDHYAPEPVLAPDLPVSPEAAIAELQALLDTHQPELIVGSSLGGFYTLWLNRQHPTPAVLINPALQPASLLAAYLGDHRRWCDGKLQRLTAAHLEQLRAMERPPPPPDERYLVLLGEADDVLDYRQALRYFGAARCLRQPGGDHRCTDFATHLAALDDFRNRETPSPPRRR